MLKRGAHDIFMHEDDDSAYQKFNEADIDEILNNNSTKVTYENDTPAGGTHAHTHSSNARRGRGAAPPS